MSYFPDILYITGWMWDVLLPSHHPLHHRVNVGCLISQSSFSTSQGGCGMSYFPVTILYITGLMWDVLLPSHHSLHHRVDVGCLTSQSPFSTFTGWMWDVLLPSHHSLHHMVDVGCLTAQSSFYISQGGCGVSYFPVIILYTLCCSPRKLFNHQHRVKENKIMRGEINSLSASLLTMAINH